MTQLKELGRSEMRQVEGGALNLLVAIAVATYKQLSIASDPNAACEYIKERAQPGSGTIECED